MLGQFQCCCDDEIYILTIRVADPDPVFLHGSGSGFQIFWIRFQPRFWKKVSKSDVSEENLKFMTKDRQKMKKATISY